MKNIIWDILKVDTKFIKYFEPPVTSFDCQYPEMADMAAILINKGKERKRK